MRKIILFIISIINLHCYSQSGINYFKNEKILTIKNDSIHFSIQENIADSVYLYTSTFGYNKLIKDYGIKCKTFIFKKSFKQDSLDYSHFTYSLYRFYNGNQSLIKNGVHYGKYFPNRPKSLKTLKGNITTIPVNSKYLNEKRNIYIYKPPTFDVNKIYNLLFILDGSKNSIKYHCSLIENLINEDEIEDLIVVGIPNREVNNNLNHNEEIDYRALELLEGYSTSNHMAHHGHSKIPNELINRHNDFINFLEKEVYSYIETNFNITKNYYKKTIYGTSNGGAFIVSLSIKKPNLFGSNIAFSFGWDYSVKKPLWDNKEKSKFYLAVGKYEEGFIDVVNKWKSILEKEKSDFKFSIELSGHDNAMWSYMFVKYIKDIYHR